MKIRDEADTKEEKQGLTGDARLASNIARSIAKQFPGTVSVETLEAQLKKNPDKTMELMRDITEEAEQYCKQEKETLIAGLVQQVANGMNDETKVTFIGEYAYQKFAPALEELDIKTLRLLLESDMGKVYAELHASCLEHGGFGVPAKIIKKVSETAKDRGPEEQVRMIIGALGGFVQEELASEDKGNRKPLTWEKAYEDSFMKGPIEELLESPISSGIKLRNQISEKLRDQPDVMQHFTKVFSIKAYAPALAMLKSETRGWLEGAGGGFKAPSGKELDVDAIMRESGAINKMYVQSHATILKKGGFGVPAKIIEYAAKKIDDPELQALAITGAVMEAAKLGISRAPGEVENEKMIKKGEETGKAFIDQIVGRTYENDAAAISKELCRRLQIPTD